MNLLYNYKLMAIAIIKIKRYKEIGMKNIFKKKMLLLLSIIMIFSTACNKGESSASDVNGKQTAMGRYVEKTLEYPLENIKGVNKMVKRSDGSLDYYMRLEEDPYNVLYNTEDGINWNKRDMPWYDEITKTGYDIVSIAYDKNDNICVLAAGGENWEYKIFKVTADNQVEEIKVDWKESEIEGVGVSIEDFDIVNNGDLILHQLGKGIMQYSTDGVFKSQYGSSGTDKFTVSGDNVFIIDQESSQVSIYDSNTYGLLKSVPYDNITYEAALSSGNEGSIYLTDRSGVYRLSEEGSLWERIIDGELASLSIPSQYFSGIIEGKDSNFYMIYSNESSSTIVKYEYDENLSSMPGTELTIYTLAESKTLRQAAGEFQHKNSDIKVNIKVGMDSESSVTKSDAIKTLNTELLSGKGPDLILLDGMPIDSFISKGVLTDLSDVLNATKNNGEDLIKDVTNVYKKGSKIYAVPAKFIVPSMWIDEQYSSEMSSLDELADFSEKHNDMQVLTYYSPEDLIRLFSLTSAPYWRDDNGNIKDNEFKEFLVNIKRINDADKKFFIDKTPNDKQNNGGNNPKMQSMVDSMDNGTGIFNWAFDRTYASCDNLIGYNSVSIPTLAIKHRNGGTVIPLPGQLQRVFIPVNSIGVNANSHQLDIAKEFVGTMLSYTVQNAQTYDGFPVNIKSLEYGAEGNGNQDIYIGISSDNGDELSGPMPTAEDLKKVKDLCLSLTTPSIVDETLLGMIIDETEGYFTGEKTIEKAVDDVKEKTKLYLSE